MLPEVAPASDTIRVAISIASFVGDRAMDIAEIGIRRLVAADAEIFRDIRLESLRCNPEAFGSSFAAESVNPASWFADRLSSSFVLGAFHAAELIGIATLIIQAGDKRAHKGSLVGMYVRSNARRAGVGRRLVEAVIDLAREHVELIQLSVVKENEAARRLYAGVGFLDYGIELHALKQGGRYYDEFLMAKDLTRNQD
jgi:ribosomal protein S18 acetylase RimI-like enzyme